MLVHHHAHLPREQRDGTWYCRVAGRAQGSHALEAWQLVIEPDAEALLEGQGAELVLLVQQGQGRLLAPSGPQRLSAPCTVCLPAPAGVVLQNIGATPLQLLLLHPAPARAEP